MYVGIDCVIVALLLLFIDELPVPLLPFIELLPDVFI
jgi:hypothetical protein